MKLKLVVLLFTLLANSAFADAPPPPMDHSGHARKHYFVLMGTGEEIFASHLVYTPPHNYNVLLQLLNMDAKLRDTYLAAKKAHPNDVFSILFDHFVVGDIRQKPELRGSLVEQDEQENETVLLPGAVFQPESYKILFFEEVPTS